VFRHGGGTMKLERLIAASYSGEAAKTWKAYVPRMVDRLMAGAYSLNPTHPGMVMRG
jgi:hypothetical protein